MFANGFLKGLINDSKNVLNKLNLLLLKSRNFQVDKHLILVLWCLNIHRNVIHGSDSVESAKKEIALWFPDGTVNWQSSLHPWIYE